MLKQNQLSALKEVYSILEDLNEQVHNDVPIDDNTAILCATEALAVAFQDELIDGVKRVIDTDALRRLVAMLCDDLKIIIMTDDELFDYVTKLKVCDNRFDKEDLKAVYDWIQREKKIRSRNEEASCQS